ncbi:MAG: DUF3021 family protein [Treponema sp.]|nr:DUF3021 family protein [Treponema sp.]
MNENIKKIILYIFASTGTVFFLYSIYGIISGGISIDSHTILEIIGANTVITIGLFLFENIKFRYAIFEILLDIGYMVVVIVIFGLLFNWYNYIPIWIPIIIVFIVYTIFYLLGFVRIRKDIEEINELLKKNKEKEKNMPS